MAMTPLEAATAGLTVYESAKPCRRCRAVLRYTSNNTCVACAKATAAKWRTKLRRTLKRGRREAKAGE